jgi:hypothetical protein
MWVLRRNARDEFGFYHLSFPPTNDATDWRKPPASDRQGADVAC